ncbi:N-acetyltransferase [Actinoplanes sp. NPDC049668]|uniref:N-acetyltransferase n=1 Tax=unclassified Actinoplanes TaxID=2626549 RepID=UPI0033A08EFE
MDLEIATAAERPDFVPRWSELDGLWPEFMTKDRTGAFFYGYEFDHHPEFQLLAVDADTGRAVAKAHSVPVSFDDPIEDGLPEDGWDWAIRRAAHDRLRGIAPTMVSALEIMIRPDLRGTGLSGRMLAAMRANVAARGFTDLVAPVRPTGAQGRPIDAYADERRADGLPVDPWLRVHVRAGGRIVNVAHSSMVMAGTLAQWREWTGLPFDETGPVTVPHALGPVHCDVSQNHAVYVEPNVWVHHRL